MKAFGAKPESICAFLITSQFYMLAVFQKI